MGFLRNVRRSYFSIRRKPQILKDEFSGGVKVRIPQLKEKSITHVWFNPMSCNLQQSWAPDQTIDKASEILESVGQKSKSRNFKNLVVQICLLGSICSKMHRVKIKLEPK